MRRAALMALPVLLAAPGCALIDGIRGGDEEILPLECEPYCFVTVIGTAGDGAPTALVRRDSPLEFLVGNSQGEIVTFTPQDAENGGFTGRVSTTPQPVVDIALGHFDSNTQNDFATSFQVAGMPGDFNYPIFFRGDSPPFSVPGFPPPVSGDRGLIVACNASTFVAEELLTFHDDTVLVWDVTEPMPAPGSMSIMLPVGFQPIDAVCEDFDGNSTDDLAILVRTVDGDRLAVFLNDGASGIGVDPIRDIPLPEQSGRETRAVSLDWVADEQLIAVAFECGGCGNQPWEIIRKFQMPSIATAEFPLQVDAIEHTAPFGTTSFTTGDFDGDSNLDYAIAGVPPAGAPPSGGLPPNLILFFQDSGLPPLPVEAVGADGDTHPISAISAARINQDNQSDIVLIAADGSGKTELQVLLTNESQPMPAP